MGNHQEGLNVAYSTPVRTPESEMDMGSKRVIRDREFAHREMRTMISDAKSTRKSVSFERIENLGSSEIEIFHSFLHILDSKLLEY